MEIHRSARKHGIGDADIAHAAGSSLVAYRIDDDAPVRELRLGFDTHGRLLEIVVLLLDSGDELVIHAMKARPQYFDLLP
ncbi:toxin [Kocuria sp. CPCC 205268]|uniref:toxin n=1 Tax=Kocuria oxytropis TaxID=3058913 RepID=UPI0034D689AE